jgi:hypothetical protein
MVEKLSIIDIIMRDELIFDILENDVKHLKCVCK